MHSQSIPVYMPCLSTCHSGQKQIVISIYFPSFQYRELSQDVKGNSVGLVQSVIECMNVQLNVIDRNATDNLVKNI